LSTNAGEYQDEIKENVRLMIILDVIFAKGRFALKQNATLPEISEDGPIRLKGARHPLLDPKKAVPIDVLLGDDYNLLIITGPNTGGKTVSLKTVGLLCLMALSGLHIPAKSGSCLPVFTQIYADIGDEQSIEQSLSTFSGHMKSIVKILEKADYKSLCLFDELGAGTDPIEGAALARAILEELQRKRAKTLATTHYAELKSYALETPGVENASCEFDVETLSPTYRLITGLPGKSNAFAIAGKLGIPKKIIRAAEEHIDKKDKGFEDLIADLDRKRLEMEKKSQELAELEAEERALKEKLEKQHEKASSAKEKILAEANRQARSILQEAKLLADESIKAFRNTNANTEIRDLEEKRTQLRKAIEKTGNTESLGEKEEVKTEGQNLPPSEWKIGDTLRIQSMGMTGELASLPDKKGNCHIQCGSMTTTANIKDLRFLSRKKKEQDASGARKNIGTKPSLISKAATISPEINLIGKTTEEALYDLEHYLDDAYLARLSSVRIVHGKGSGILRDAVRRYLKRVKYIESFRAGEFGEGDSGVTIASFRD
ncbi:MAG: Smr/MutS family protein, partial [Lachnospiraceae bacterium]|nr:Smr/MutS family protein [Lachnospiraceae bacterium]